MSIFRTRYRIVRDRYSGFELQFRYWWMPMYAQAFFSNTSSSLENAKTLIERHRALVVYQE